MGLRHRHGHSTSFQRVGLPEIRRVSPFRNQRHPQPNIRGFPDVHQRRRLLNPHGVLLEDVLRDPRLAGLELERLANRQEDGASGFHRLPLLVAHSVLLVNSGVRTSVSDAGTSQSLHGFRAAAELLLQSVPVRHLDEAVQEGLRHDLQGD